jgi:multimeric flavodoxin WrbA
MAIRHGKNEVQGMKVTAFVGSARKKATYRATEQFLAQLQSFSELESEIVVLSDYRLELCRGCKVCFDKGETCCPLNDDVSLLIEKMMHSDGVVFATPNYSFQVSAWIKTFLDRLGFAFHRPRFFGKTCTSLVVQGIYGGGSIVKYLDFVGGGLGFNTVKGSCLTALEPMSPKEQRKIDKTLARHSRRFHAQLTKPAYPAPTLFKLMAFRMARMSMKLNLDERYRDYTYFAEQGWFASDYYYPVRLGPLKKLAGIGFDRLGAAMAKERNKTMKRE